jgi:hypothetical protein
LKQQKKDNKEYTKGIDQLNKLEEKLIKIAKTP